MRRSEKEIVDRSQIEAIIKRALVCRVALCDEGLPYVIPVNFGYDNGCLYIHGTHEGKKLDILKRNSKVAFEVDIDHALVAGKTPCSYTFNYRSVVGSGTAVILHNLSEKRKGMNAIVSHYAGNDDIYPDDALAKVTVVRIETSSMTGRQSGY
ncbi:MAG: pyridoxamine 5'-phosphate oxidase family protein [Candidatus Bipolaricaulota bacterium]|nr:pyridoxamine 5'-phosphate oxidase family protein [Candidatus Bipolaricaulota bacterium]